MTKSRRTGSFRALPALVLGLFAAGSGGRAFAQAPVPGDPNQPPQEMPPLPTQDEAYDEGPPPPEALPPPQPPTEATFEQELSPYGRWVSSPEYGRVWQPNATQNPDWQPYTDGRWVYTEWGWSFVPEVPWSAPFHYGRWGWASNMGWYWVPGSVWAPAWVSWRYTNGHVAWSPYAPVGYRYPQRWPGWVAMPANHFTHPIRREALPRAHAVNIIRGARVAPSIERHAPERGRAYGPPRGAVGPRGNGRGPPPGRGGPVHGAPAHGGEHHH